MNRSNTFKEQAALKAVEFVESGMILGLGSGSTTLYALEAIGSRIQNGDLTSIIGIPSSTKTADDARRFGIPLGTLDKFPIINLTIDGADEVDPDQNLIKGGGGALLHEKILAQNSRRFIIVVDETKLSPALGTKRKVPVEVIQFGYRLILKFLESLGSTAILRTTDKGLPFVTDEGNYIIDCKFDPISDPFGLAEKLKNQAGIVEHGLFLRMATDVIVGGETGVYHHKSKNPTD
jgi:ribose 5-phosphate isomerase A